MCTADLSADSVGTAEKEDDNQKAAPTTVAKITTVATEAATTAPPANDGATPDGSETTVSGSDLTTTTVTTEAAGEYVPLANADESYFEDALFIGNSNCRHVSFWRYARKYGFLC